MALGGLRNIQLPDWRNVFCLLDPGQFVLPRHGFIERLVQSHLPVEITIGDPKQREAADGWKKVFVCLIGQFSWLAAATQFSHCGLQLLHTRRRSATWTLSSVKTAFNPDSVL